ncbi:MAG: sodium-dependent transporter [bacterium]|nr:sodium-dependent transporter [bacterium]
MSQQRGQWSGRLGFILAAAGSAVGLGNLWKFPYITLENNGGAFVLVYIGAVILVGLPIMFAEVLLGRRAQKDPVGTFRLLSAGKPGASLWPGVGILGVITGFIILSYYSVVAGWTIRYIIMALSGQLGELATNADANVLGNFFGDFLGNSTEQAVYYTLFMGATIGVVYFGVANGIERVAKILVPVLFIILLALTAYSTTTSGFREALHFLFRPNFSELTTGSILEALGHSFFTLSLGMGAMLTYGSYMRKQDSIPKAVVTISILDTVIAILACIIMFSIIFTMQAIQPDFEVGKSSTILFTTLPLVFYKLPGGGFISAVFYLLVAFAALTSTISLMEVVSSFAIDEFKWSRKRAVLTMGSSIFVFGLLSAVSLGGNETLSGINLIGRESTAGVFGTLDYLATNWLLPLGGLLIALFVGWILGRAETQEELEEGHGLLVSYSTWRFLIKFVAPLAVGAIIVSVILGAEYQ